MKLSYHIWTLVALSALSYALAFILPHLWWLTFVAFFLLFHTALRFPLSFKEGLLWGTLFFALQESGIFYSLAYMAQGSFYSLLTLGLTIVCVIFYQALYSGLWFSLTHLLVSKRTSVFYKLALWVITSRLFITFIDHYVLWIFGVIEGYPLAHPLLPWAQQPFLLSLLPTLGKKTLTLIFLSSAALSAYALTLSKPLTRLALLILACSPWIISYVLYHPSTKAPPWLSTLAVLPQSFYNPSDEAKTIKDVAHKLRTIAMKYPAIQVILLPESALYLCDLSTRTDLSLWNSKNLGRPLHILIGALYKEQALSYNTIYWIYDGAIKGRFCKKHALLLTERLPSWALQSPVQDLYYANNRPFITPSCNKRPLFTISDTIQLVPYICSELFFKEHPDDTFKDATIASFCNDTWIEASYVERLMRLMHQFRAIEWQRAILYIDYTHSTLYDSTGMALPLLSL
jgi:apolipoprotein N-acyltransferase